MEGRRNLTGGFFFLSRSGIILDTTGRVTASHSRRRSNSIQFDPIQPNSTGSAADIQIYIHSIYKYTCSQRRGDMDGEPCRSGFESELNSQLEDYIYIPSAGATYIHVYTRRGEGFRQHT